jgi:hypothetical protein
MIEEKVVKHSPNGQVEKVTDRPGGVDAVVILLYIFAAIAAIGFLSGNLNSVIPLAVNLVLAAGLMKMKLWAKTWTIIRCVWGIAFNLLTFGPLAGSSQDVSAQMATYGMFDLVRFVVIILLLTQANVRKPYWG